MRVVERHRDVASTLARRWLICTHWVFTDVLIDMQLYFLVSHNSFKTGSVYVCKIDFLCILYCIYGSETLIKYLYLYLLMLLSHRLTTWRSHVASLV